MDKEMKSREKVILKILAFLLSVLILIAIGNRDNPCYETPFGPEYEECRSVFEVEKDKIYEKFKQ